jgi:FixJ family two-component response regulator
MRGTDLAREVQALQPGMAVLLVSGYSAELLDLSQTAPASWELLAKPYSRGDLQSAMVQAMAARGAAH